MVSSLIKKITFVFSQRKPQLSPSIIKLIGSASDKATLVLKGISLNDEEQSILISDFSLTKLN